MYLYCGTLYLHLYICYRVCYTNSIVHNTHLYITKPNVHTHDIHNFFFFFASTNYTKYYESIFIFFENSLVPRFYVLNQFEIIFSCCLCQKYSVIMCHETIFLFFFN